MKCLSKFIIPIMLSGAVIAVPTRGWAQPALDKSASEKSPAQTTEPAKAEKKPKAGPFHGKLVAIDKVAKTITVGKRTFQITSETRINKARRPATLDDGVVGEEASGYIKPREDGKLVATTVNFGPKAEAGSAEKKNKETDK